MQNKTAIMAMVGVAVLASVITFSISSDAENSLPSAADSTFASGHVTAYLFDADGNVKAYRQTDNVIVNTGLDIIANQVFGNGTITNSTAEGGSSGGTVGYLALGTGGNSAPEAGQTVLTTYLSGCANLTDGSNSGTDWEESSDTTGDATNVVIISNTTFQGSAGCTSTTVNEVGLFTALTGTQDGKLFAIQEFSDINVGSSDTLTINWDITFTDS